MYGSVCSGIEAATVAWHPLGWEPAWFSEIEPFPCAVLAHHYPSVPNLGDMTTIRGRADVGPIDLLVGGTPCQSFSVAGLRKGLDDPRGNLALEFLAIADHLKPRWVVFENVPGILSDSTHALHCFMDGLEEIGYIIVGFDILDAQWFGLAQRRRRVFVCGHRADDLRNARTPFSGLILVQCLAEIWHSTLAVLSARLSAGVANSDSASSRCEDSLSRRTRLFGLQTDAQALMWLPNLDALLPWYECGHGGSDSENGSPSPRTPPSTGATECPRSSEPQAATAGFQNTASSWSSIWADALRTTSGCITSTASSETIESRIYTCAQALLNTSRFMLGLNRSLPNFSHAAASCLTAMLGYIEHARSTSTSLFAGVDWVRRWSDFLAQAEPATDALCDIGVECFGAVLPLSESVCGHPPPSRGKGEGTAADAAPSLVSSGRGVERTGETRGQDPVVAVPDIFLCLNAGGMGRIDAESETLVAHSLRAEGHDASEDGTGRGTPVVLTEPMAFLTKSIDTNDIANTRGVRMLDYSPSLMGGTGETGNMLPKVLERTGGVRRLTPRECERLQGFPDDYTLIPYHGKPAADAPRYKALGNSMACNVMRFIGERIQMVEQWTPPRGAEGTE